MTKLHYPNISSGFLGIETKDASLASSFYGEILHANYDFSKRIVFPQRVPKNGFFEELCQLETHNYHEIFSKKTQLIKDTLLSLINQYQTNNNFPPIINWLNVLFRFGQSGFITQLNAPTDLPLENLLEFQLMKEMAKIEVSLSNDELLNLDHLIQLTEKIKSSPIDIKIKMYALGRVIVNGARHGSKNVKNNPTSEYTNNIIELLASFNEENFRAQILKSMLYRGIAMASIFGVDQQSTWLKNAESIAREINGQSTTEKIAAQDNLYTCLQTQSKWNSHLQLFKEAENNLREMISINPFDSTAYSELGFFLMKFNKHEEAANNFKLAIKLGPPGVGMNAYYYATCLQQLGKNEDAVSAFYQCISYDHHAISPWLELFDYYVTNDKTDETRKIAKHLLSTKTLREQLEPEEIEKLEHYS